MTAASTQISRSPLLKLRLVADAAERQGRGDRVEGFRRDGDGAKAEIATSARARSAARSTASFKRKFGPRHLPAPARASEGSASASRRGY
jgi:hypothetical protein